MEILEWLKSGWNIVMVVLGLGLIIFLHELGHFLMAKKNKVRVEIFSLGFGHAIFKFRRGETEYRIAWLPLGGYVKMAGETLTDDRKGDPGELTSKTPWQRFQIFVAGALMNLIIAFPIGMAAYLLGKYEYSNEVGTPGTAEALGGMKPGDIVTEVNNRRVESLDKFRIEMVRHQNGTVVPVKVKRRTESGERVDVPLNITAMASEYHSASSVSLRMVDVKPGSPLAAQGVKPYDEIYEIDGAYQFSKWRADALLRSGPGKEFALGIRRRNPDFKDDTFQVKVLVPEKVWHVLPTDESMIEPIVGRIEPGRTVTNVLQLEDRILRIDGQTIASWKDLKDIVEKRPTEELAIVVLREGKEETFRVRTTYQDSGMGALGIGPKDTNVFASVKEGSYLHKVGVRTGDRLVSVDGHSCRTFRGMPKDVPPILDLRDEKERTITIKVEREGSPQPIEAVLKTIESREGDLAAVGFQTYPGGAFAGRLFTIDSKPFRRRAFGDAIVAGLWEPIDVTVMTFEILRKLVTGGESAKGLSGPVGIIYASYKFVDMSFGNFVWLLCLITVNLGIFNLLPIPILDGGHNVLLLIEVVRKWLGKPPPSERFVATFQYTGLIFILALFVFVTWNDISRFWGPR